METLLKLTARPIIITSCGDGFSDNWMRPDYPSDFKEVSRLSDITFSTQMGKAADKMVEGGANNIVFTPNSMCQVRFKADEIDVDNHSFDFDVVFVSLSCRFCVAFVSMSCRFHVDVVSLHVAVVYSGTV